jgi:hypothetical protein
MARPSSHLQARHKRAEAIREFNLNRKRGEEVMEKVQGKELRNARLEAARAREAVKWYQKTLKNVRKRVKRAHVSRMFLKDEKKQLKAIAAEFQ